MSVNGQTRPGPRPGAFEGEVVGPPDHWYSDPTAITLLVRIGVGDLLPGKAQAVTATGERRDIVIQDIPFIEPTAASREFWRTTKLICLQDSTLEEAATFVKILQTHPGGIG